MAWSLYHIAAWAIVEKTIQILNTYCTLYCFGALGGLYYLSLDGLRKCNL